MKNCVSLLQGRYNARKAEYYENSDKYPLDIDPFKKAFPNSCWGS